jgi:hypothetical protein
MPRIRMNTFHNGDGEVRKSNSPTHQAERHREWIMQPERVSRVEVVP